MGKIKMYLKYYHSVSSEKTRCSFEELEDASVPVGLKRRAFHAHYHIFILNWNNEILVVGEM